MDSPPKKRGRGRPPGSLNAKGSKQRGYVDDTPSTAHTLDVDFESDEVLGGENFSEDETLSVVVEPPSPPPSPKPVRKKPVRATKPTPPVEREAREQSPVPAPVTAARKAPRASKPRKARAVADGALSAEAKLPRQETQPQLTPDDYLGFLRRITDISNARNRSARAERYDNFFRV